jgi:hypothetical protein
MRLIVPAGIGDWSWMFSALYSVRDELTAVRVVDGAPRRTVPYIKACGVKDADYDSGPEGITGGQYAVILAAEAALGLDYQSKPTWKKIRSLVDNAGPKATILLEANKHLEAGLPLSDWLPDLPCEYHYPLYVSDEDRKLGREKTLKAIVGSKREQGHPMSDGPVVGISCASYKGADAWDTWGREEWIDFLKRVMQLGWRPLPVGGGWDDLTATVAEELDLPFTVGRTSVPQMIEQMDFLDAYIGFSSGMNVIRTVLDRPAMALWPCNQKCDQKELSTSWVPPHMLESRRYVAVTWRPVDDVWPVAKAFLRRCEKEIANEARRPTISRVLTSGYNGSGEKESESADV